MGLRWTEPGPVRRAGPVRGQQLVRRTRPVRRGPGHAGPVRPAGQRQRRTTPGLGRARRRLRGPRPPQAVAADRRRRARHRRGRRRSWRPRSSRPTATTATGPRTRTRASCPRPPTCPATPPSPSRPSPRSRRCPRRTRRTSSPTAKKDTAPLSAGHPLPGQEADDGRPRLRQGRHGPHRRTAPSATQGALGAVLDEQRLRPGHPRHLQQGRHRGHRRRRRLRHRGAGQEGRRSRRRAASPPLPGAGVPAFCQGGRSAARTSNSYGRYAYFTVAGFTNGKDVTKGDTKAVPRPATTWRSSPSVRSAAAARPRPQQQPAAPAAGQ